MPQTHNLRDIALKKEDMSNYYYFLLIPICVIIFFGMVYWKNRKIPLNGSLESTPAPSENNFDSDESNISPSNTVMLNGDFPGIETPTDLVVEPILDETDSAPEIPADHPELPTQEDIDRAGEQESHSDDIESEDIVGVVEDTVEPPAPIIKLINSIKAFHTILKKYDEKLLIVIHSRAEIVTLSIGGHHNNLLEEAVTIGHAIQSLEQLMSEDANHSYYDLKVISKDGVAYNIPEPYLAITNDRIVFKITSDHKI